METMPQWLSIGFTGHRKITHPHLAEEKIRSTLQRFASPSSAVVGVCSCAAGADTIFLKELHRRKLPSLIVLPFPRHRFEQDFSPEEWQCALMHIDHAVHYETIGLQSRDEHAYMEAGERTVDQSDVLIALWDGEDSSGLGGTADVVRYARALQKPLIWIHSETGNIVEENLDRLCAVPQRSESAETPRQLVEKTFAAFDEAAQRQAPKARHLVLNIIVMHLIASSIGLFLTVFSGRLESPHTFALFLGAIEFVLLVMALTLTYFHRRPHEQWLIARIKAEICRSFLATWPLRRRITTTVTLSTRAFDRDLRNLLFTQWIDASPVPKFEDVRSSYVADRISKQIDYFGKQATKARRSIHWLKLWGRGSTLLAIICTIATWTMKHHGDWWYQWPKFLSLALPLFSAALFSIIVTQDYSRRASRYEEMRLLLQDKTRQISAIQTPEALAQAVLATEQVLLQEVVEWHAFTRFVGEPH